MACGTGNHLKYLSEEFDCTGLDISEEMIQTAKEKIPKASFEVGDMKDFELDAAFDVITCLFGSIGFAKTYEGLVETLKNLERHLPESGILLIEPWVYLSDFEGDRLPALTTVEEEDFKLVRMSNSETKDSKWILHMHYLVGEKDGIEHFHEGHEMLAVERSDYLDAFKEAGFEVEDFIEKGEKWTGARVLFLLKSTKKK